MSQNVCAKFQTQNANLKYLLNGEVQKRIFTSFKTLGQAFSICAVSHDVIMTPSSLLTLFLTLLLGVAISSTSAAGA